MLPYERKKKINGVSASNKGNKTCCPIRSFFLVYKILLIDIKYQEIPKGKVKYN